MELLIDDHLRLGVRPSKHTSPKQNVCLFTAEIIALCLHGPYGSAMQLGIQRYVKILCVVSPFVATSILYQVAVRGHGGAEGVGHDNDSVEVVGREDLRDGEGE